MNNKISLMVDEFMYDYQEVPAYEFNRLLVELFDEINGLSKKEKFIKLIILELKFEIRSSEKELCSLKEKSEKVKKRIYINDLELKKNYALKLLKEIKIQKRKVSEIERKTNNIQGKFSFGKEKTFIQSGQTISEKIEQKVRNYESIECFDIVDVIKAFRNTVKEYDIIDNKELLFKYSYNINYELMQYIYENSDILLEFNSLLDNIKLKISKFPKESEERKILKCIYRTLKDISIICSNNNEQIKKENPYFEILDYWIKDDSNYIYVKELLKRKKDVCNIHNNDEHIVIHILDLYLDNFRKMLKDRDSSYINPTYLKEIYFLFTKNYYLRITDEEKEQIDLKIKEFIYYVKTTLIKQKRKNAAIDELKSMKTNLFYKSIQNYSFEEFDDDLLAYEKGRIRNCVQNYVINKDTTDSIIIGDFAYNISQEENMTFLTMYSFDPTSFIKRDTIMDRYLEKCELLKQPIDDFTHKGFKFKKGETYPAIAYELEFYPSGRFKNLEVKYDIIKINEQFIPNESSEKAEKIYELYNKSVLKNGGELSQFDLYKLNDHFERILNNAYMEFLNREKLPFIYYGYSVPTDYEIESNLNELNNILYKLDKSDSREIINIFSSKIDVLHYSNLPIPNGVYDLKLIDSFSYLGLENQRMLCDLHFNQRKFEDIRRLYKLKLEYLSDYIKKVDELNQNIGYVDPSKIKISKGKIKNKSRL